MSKTYIQFIQDAPRIKAFMNGERMFTEKTDILYLYLKKKFTGGTLEKVLYYFTQSCLSQAYIDRCADNDIKDGEHLISIGSQCVMIDTDQQTITVTKEFNHVFLCEQDEMFIIDLFKCKIIYNINSGEEYTPEWSSLVISELNRSDTILNEDMNQILNDDDND